VFSCPCGGEVNNKSDPLESRFFDSGKCILGSEIVDKPRDLVDISLGLQHVTHVRRRWPLCPLDIYHSASLRVRLPQIPKSGI
jgi:hypothetical protein